MDFKGKAQELIEDEKSRKWLVISVILIVIFLFLKLSDSDDPIDFKTLKETNRITSVFGIGETSDKIQDVEVNGVLEQMRSEFAEKERAFEEKESRMLDELDKVQERFQDQQGKLLVMERHIEALSRVPRGRSGDIVRGQRQGELVGPDGAPIVIPTEQPQQQPSFVVNRPTQIVTPEPIEFDNDLIRTVTQRQITDVRENGVLEVQEAFNSTLSQHTMRNLSQEQRAVANREELRRNENDNGEFTLSTGSIISGTLISGVAAPTGVNASSAPIPVLMRVKREAIMPNSFTLDIRECHMIGEAVGSLADERAQIRAISISCITESGQAIERSIQAFAVSATDGLAGIKGTVVSRSGKALSNSLTAGFFSGFSNAAAPNQVRALNTEPDSTVLFQSQNISRFTGAGALQGASDALNRLSDYYLSLVEQTFPVIEVLPGIEVDFIVQRGMTINLDPELQEQVTAVNAPVAPTQLEAPSTGQ